MNTRCEHDELSKLRHQLFDSEWKNGVLEGKIGVAVDVSALQRYDNASQWEHDMQPHGDGDWVKFSDVKALIKGATK